MPGPARQCHGPVTVAWTRGPHGLEFCNMSFVRSINEGYALVCRTDVSAMAMNIKLVRKGRGG